jgi:hypothetical protein
VEVELVHEILEFDFPPLDFLEAIAIKLLGLIVGADKLDARWNSEDLLLGFVLGPDNLEDGVEGDHEPPLADLALDGVVEDSFGREDEDHGGSAI